MQPLPGERDSWLKSMRQVNDARDEELDKLEAETKKMLGILTGKEEGPNKQVLKRPAKLIERLRAAKIKMKIVPTTQDGKAAPVDGLVHLEDSLREGMGERARRWAEHPPAAAESREWMAQQKYVYDAMDLSMHVLAASQACFSANIDVQTNAMTPLYPFYFAAARAKSTGAEFGDEERTEARRAMMAMERSRTIAAIATAALASLQAAVDGKPTTIIEKVAEHSLEAFPIAPKSPADADVDQWIKDVPRLYESENDKTHAFLKESYGEKKYERLFGDARKRELAQREAMHQESASPPGSKPMFSGTRDPGPAPETPAASKKPMAGATGKALEAATAQLPEGGAVRSSVEGVIAITKGDYKTAMGAALKLVPGGSVVGDGLGLAGSLLGIRI